MKVKSIAECSPWSILQYFWPALSDKWSWKPIFGLFESGRFRQVLLHILMEASFDTLIVFLKECFEKVNFEKAAKDKKAWKF